MESIRSELSFRKNLLVNAWMKRKYRIKIRNTKETLEVLINRKKSISRFGDGEFNLIFGNSLKFQDYEERLGQRLKEILKAESEEGNCGIAIPYVYAGFEDITKESKQFWVQYFRMYRRKIYSLLNPKYEYLDAQITRIYVNRKNKEDSRTYFALWRKLWEGQEVLLVEGELSRFGVGNDLFDNVGSLERILCPAKNAFDHYEEIEECVRKRAAGKLVLLVLGPTATVLAYDLAKAGFWVIDAGNLDMEYEWSRCRSDRQTAVAGKYTLEAADGTKVAAIEDGNYWQQVVEMVGISSKEG